MPECLICRKPTSQKFCCTEHSDLWYRINYPYMVCLECGEQLYPYGRSKKEFEKVLFCSKHCSGEFLQRDVSFYKPFYKEGPNEKTVKTLLIDKYTPVQILMDKETHMFTFVYKQWDKIIKSNKTYNSRKILIDYLIREF